MRSPFLVFSSCFLSLHLPQSDSISSPTAGVAMRVLPYSPPRPRTRPTVDLPRVFLPLAAPYSRSSLGDLIRRTEFGVQRDAFRLNLEWSGDRRPGKRPLIRSRRYRPRGPPAPRMVLDSAAPLFFSWLFLFVLL